MRITLILGLKEMEYGLDRFRSEQVPAVPCEHGNYSAGFIKGKGYRDKLSNYYLLKNLCHMNTGRCEYKAVTVLVLLKFISSYVGHTSCRSAGLDNMLSK